MTSKTIRVLATGGTIAGSGALGTGRAYIPGRIGIAEMAAEVRALGIAAELEAVEIAAIGSQDIGWPEWDRLHEHIMAAQSAHDVDGIIITHGTDSAEETALLLDLTLPAETPVVLVGAMRPVDAVGSDGMRNFANAVRVASDPGAAGRGVLVVMGDQIFAASDVRKASTSSIDAFRGFPRGPIGNVTPVLARLVRAARQNRRACALRVAAFTAPGRHSQRLRGHAPLHRRCGAVVRRARDRAGGYGAGQCTRRGARCAGWRGAQRRAGGAREPRRPGLCRPQSGGRRRRPGFVAARSYNPAKARILLQMLIASGIKDAATMQAHFDRR